MIHQSFQDNSQALQFSYHQFIDQRNGRCSKISFRKKPDRCILSSENAMEEVSINWFNFRIVWYLYRKIAFLIWSKGFLHSIDTILIHIWKLIIISEPYFRKMWFYISCKIHDINLPSSISIYFNISNDVFLGYGRKDKI